MRYNRNNVYNSLVRVLKLCDLYEKGTEHCIIYIIDIHIIEF